MNNDLDNLQLSVNSIADEVKSLKAQSVKNAVSLDDINSSIDKISNQDILTKDTLYDTQEKMADYLTSHVNANIEGVTKNIDILKNTVQTEKELVAVEFREILGGLSLKISTVQDSLKTYTDDKYSDLNENLSGLKDILNSTIDNIDKKNDFLVSELNENIVKLNKTVNDSFEADANVQNDNYKTLFSIVAGLSQKLENFKTENLEELGDLNANVKEVRAGLEAVNSSLFSYMQAEFTELKNSISNFDIAELRSRISDLRDFIVSNSDLPIIKNGFTELHEQLTNIADNFQNDSVDKEFAEDLSSSVNEFREKIESFSKLSQDEFEEFKKAMIVFNESLNTFSQKNDVKLEEALEETSSIKMEVLALKESVSEYNLDGILKENLDNVFVQLSKLEQAISEKDSVLLEKFMEYAENSFSDVIKNLNTGENNLQNADIDSLRDRVELLKNELNLIASDILDNFSARFNELSAIKDDLKSFVSDSLTSVQEHLKEEIQFYLKSILAVTDSEGQKSSVNTEILSDIKNLEMSISDTLNKISEGIDTVNNDFAKLSENETIVANGIDEIKLSIKENSTQIFNYFDERLTATKEYFDEKYSGINSNIEGSLNQIQQFLENAKNVSLSNKEELLAGIEASYENMMNNQEKVNLDEITDALENIRSINISNKEDILAYLEKNIETALFDGINKISSDTKEYLSVSTSSTEEMNEELKIFFKDEVEGLKETLIDKIHEISSINPDESMNVSGQLEKELTSVFESYFDKLNNNDVIIEKFEDVTANFQEHVDNLKVEILDEFITRFQDFKEFYSAQNNMLKLSSEIKNSINGLEEKFVETNVNSTMEISKLLFSVLTEISKLKTTEVSEDEIKVVPRAESHVDISDIEKTVFDAKEELKKILAIQHPLIKQIETLGSKEDFEILQNNIKEVLIAFNAKLDAIIASNKDDAMQKSLHLVIESVEKTLNNFGKEIISSVVGIFNGINFDVEKQDIKDYVKENSEDIKNLAVENFALLSSQINKKSTDILENSNSIKEIILTEIREFLYENIKASILNSFEEHEDELAQLKDVLSVKFDDFSNKASATISTMLTYDRYNAQAQKIDDKIQELSTLFIDKISNLDIVNDSVKDQTKTLDIKFSNLKGDVVDIVKATFKEVFDEKYSEFITGFDNVQTLFNQITKNMEDVQKGFEELKPEIFLEFRNNIQNAVTSLSEKINTVDEHLFAQAEEIIQKVKDNSSALSDKINTLDANCSTNFEELKNNSKENCSNIVEKIEASQTFVSELEQNLHKIINEKIDALLTLDKSQEYAESFNSKIEGFAGDVIDKLTSVDCLNDLIKDQTSSFALNLEELKSDIVDIVKTNLSEEFNEKYAVIKEETEKELEELKKSNELNIQTGFENAISDISELKTSSEKELNDIKLSTETNMKSGFEDVISNISDLKTSSEKELNDIKLSTENNMKSGFEDVISNISDLKTSSEKNIADFKNEIVNLITNELLAKISDNHSQTVDTLSEFKSDVLGNLATIQDYSQKSDLNISDIKDLIINKFEEIDEIKSELSLIPKEKGADIADIDNAFIKNIENLKDDLNISAQNRFSFGDIQNLIDQSVEALKQSISENAGSSFDIEAFQEIIDEKILNLKNELTDLQESSDITVNEIYTLLDDRTEALKNQIRGLSDEGLSVDDIRDLLNDKLDDIKADLRVLSVDLDNRELISSEFSDVKDKLDDIDKVTENVDNNCVDIKQELLTLKEHFTQIQDTIKNQESDYPYSFEDVETDILKVRMILKELTETNALARDAGLEKIEEDLVSISTRTNKLLLTSESTAEFLQSSIEDLKNLVTLFDNKVNEFDYQRMFDKLDNRLNEISDAVYANAIQNKKLTEAFTYLAEWIDKTDEKLYSLEQKIEDVSYVKKNMVTKSDLDNLLEKFIKKMDKQQEKISNLEEKLKAKKEPNLKTLVKEVLSTVPDTKLVKKVDGIDKQLATLGKNIEKITSYVD